MPIDVTTHQTVRLRRGKHQSPRDGACVMELASMLAGEEFTDAPAAVCPILAAFMRAYNDAVDDDRRQDLYGFAARAVGTGGDGQAARRQELCTNLLHSLHASTRWAAARRLGLGRFQRHATVSNAARELTKAPESHLAALTFLAGLIGARPRARRRGGGRPCRGKGFFGGRRCGPPPRTRRIPAVTALTGGPNFVRRAGCCRRNGGLLSLRPPGRRG